jgi:hypothetical protein
MDINKNTTIVTALYDIGRENWSNFRMSYHTYLWWMENTLSLNTNMVIFTESKFEEIITKNRKKIDPELKKTKIIVKDLKDTEAYKVYGEPLKNLMVSQSFISKVSFKDVPEMCQYLYNVVMFGKLNFLQEVKNKEYFPEQKFLVWADAAGLREKIECYSNTLWPDESKLDVDKITFFSHHEKISIMIKEHHALSQMRFIQGTCFIVPVKEIDGFVQGFKDIVFECIANDFIGSDEKILDFYYLSNSSKCKLIKSTWREYFNILK